MISNTEKETKDIAQKYAQFLKGGEVIGLKGKLGAGKTVFVKGLAKGLGVKGVVTSPTFVLMKVYNTDHKKIKHLVHIDAYRLTNSDDLENIGAYDYFNKESVVIIEWPQRIPQLKKFITNYIDIKFVNLKQREIIFKSEKK